MPGRPLEPTIIVRIRLYSSAGIHTKISSAAFQGAASWYQSFNTLIKQVVLKYVQYFGCL